MRTNRFFSDSHPPSLCDTGRTKLKQPFRKRAVFPRRTRNQWPCLRQCTGRRYRGEAPLRRRWEAACRTPAEPGKWLAKFPTTAAAAESDDQNDPVRKKWKGHTRERLPSGTAKNTPTAVIERGSRRTAAEQIRSAHRQKSKGTNVPYAVAAAAGSEAAESDTAVGMHSLQC